MEPVEDMNDAKFTNLKVAIVHFLKDSSSKYKLNEIADKIIKTNVEKLKIKKIDETVFDPELIHDLRVATRRLRAAIKTFNKILPTKSKKIQIELRKVGRILGKKRDLDIFIQFIIHAVNKKSISFQKVTQLSNQSQEQLITMLKSKSYSRLIKSLKNLKTLKTEQNIFRAASNRIRKKINKVLEIGSSIDSKADDKSLHKLRISIKKLRYVCEFFEPILNKYICCLNSFIEETIKIQDILGDHQDAITGISMLFRYKSIFSEKEFLQIQKKYKLKKMRTRRSFLKIWNTYLILI